MDPDQSEESAASAPSGRRASAQGPRASGPNPKEYSDQLKSAQSFVLMQTSMGKSSAEAQQERLKAFHQKRKQQAQVQAQQMQQAQLQKTPPPTKPKPSNVAHVQTKLRQAQNQLINSQAKQPTTPQSSDSPDRGLRSKSSGPTALPDKIYPESPSSILNPNSHSPTRLKDRDRPSDPHPQPLTQTKSNSSLTNMTKDEMNTCLLDFVNTRKSSLQTQQPGLNLSNQQTASILNSYVKSFQSHPQSQSAASSSANISNQHVSHHPASANSATTSPLGFEREEIATPTPTPTFNFRPQNNSLPSTVGKSRLETRKSNETSNSGPGSTLNLNPARSPTRTGSPSKFPFGPKVPPDPPKRIDSQKPNHVRSLVSSFDQKVGTARNTGPTIKSQLAHLQSKLLQGQGQSTSHGNAPSGPSRGPADLTRMLPDRSMHKPSHSLSSNNTNSSSHSSNSNSLKRSSKQSSIASSVTSEGKLALPAGAHLHVHNNRHSHNYKNKYLTTIAQQPNEKLVNLPKEELFQMEGITEALDEAVFESQDQRTSDQLSQSQYQTSGHQTGGFHTRSTSTPLRLSSAGSGSYCSNSLPRKNNTSELPNKKAISPTSLGPSQTAYHGQGQLRYPSSVLSKNSSPTSQLAPACLTSLSSSKSMINYSHSEHRERDFGRDRDRDRDHQSSSSVGQRSLHGTLPRSGSRPNSGQLQFPETSPAQASPSPFAKSYDNISKNRSSQSLSQKLSNPIPYASRNQSESNDSVCNFARANRKSVGSQPTSSRESTREISRKLNPINRSASVTSFGGGNGLGPGPGGVTSASGIPADRVRLSSGNSQGSYKSLPKLDGHSQSQSDRETPRRISRHKISDTTTNSGRSEQLSSPGSNKSQSGLFRQRKSASELLGTLSPDSKYYRMSSARARLGRSASPGSIGNDSQSAAGDALIRNGSNQSKASNDNFVDPLFESELLDSSKNSEKDADALSVKMWAEYENTKTLKKVANQFEKRSSERLAAIGRG